MEKHYEYFEHTADIGIRGYGDCFTDALEAVARGMMEQIVETGPQKPVLQQELEIKAASREELTVHFLNRLIYLFETKKFIPLEYYLTETGDGILSARLKGKAFDPQKDQYNLEVKAATYHLLEAKETPSGWQIQVVIDI
jgi:SHS2 domain-containing protein